MADRTCRTCAFGGTPSYKMPCSSCHPTYEGRTNWTESIPAQSDPRGWHMTSEQAIRILRMSEQERWRNGVEHNDVMDAINYAALALSRMDAKKPTHEATRYSSLTCPHCKNVIDSFTTAFGRKVRVMEPHCKFCGQKIDWSEEAHNVAE